MGLYHNPMLMDRASKATVVDRFIRTPVGCFESVLSLTVATEPTGMVVCVLSFDMLDQAQLTTSSVPLAVYPLSQQQHAQEDGLILSRKWSVSLRRANQGVPWSFVRLADDPERPDAVDLVIGS